MPLSEFAKAMLKTHLHHQSSIVDDDGNPAITHVEHGVQLHGQEIVDGITLSAGTGFGPNDDQSALWAPPAAGMDRDGWFDPATGRLTVPEGLTGLAWVSGALVVTGESEGLIEVSAQINYNGLNLYGIEARYAGDPLFGPVQVVVPPVLIELIEGQEIAWSVDASAAQAGPPDVNIKGQSFTVVAL